MPLPKVIIAAAGSGKTHDLVVKVLSDPNRKVLVITYTDQNLHEIRERITAINGFVPHYIHLLSWYAFLVRHCVRPYQFPLYTKKRIERPFFPKTEQDQSIRNRRYISRDDIEGYFIVDQNQIVGEFASEFAVKCDVSNGGAVIRRLEQIYDTLLIDEVQDLAGYDLVLLESLFKSSLNIQVVGDCRQVTYKTNTVSSKHRNFRDEKILDFFKGLEKQGLCEINYKSSSRRCNQQICTFADRVYPEMPTTMSENTVQTDHDGVFFISEDHLDEYMLAYSPQVLRWNRQTRTCSSRALNFGEAKGSTFDRVLIYPTGPIKQFLQTANSTGMASRAKFYVAITRARFSVAFLYDGEVHEDLRQ